MTIAYRVDLFSKAGVKQATLPYLELAYIKKVNEVGLGMLSMNGEHSSVSLLEDEAIIEIWRADLENGIDWYRDFTGLLITFENIVSNTNVVNITFADLNQVLSWRINDYPADTTNKTAFAAVKAETIMKTLIGINFGAGATTANGRTILGTDSRVVAATDLARGNTITRNNANKNILEEIQALSSIAGGDFQVSRTGTATFTFEFYPNQLGTDRTSTVVFSLRRGNVGSIRYKRNMLGLKTVAIAKGSGVKANRIKTSVTGNGYSTTNHKEIFVEETNTDSTTALQSKANVRLDENKKEETFEFKVIQVPATLYGKHYFLGDKVTAYHNGVSYTMKVNAISIKVKRGGNSIEEIDVGLLQV